MLKAVCPTAAVSASADDCRFKDPTNDVVGLSRYKQALGILFDPQYSIVKLLDIQASAKVYGLV